MNPLLVSILLPLVGVGLIWLLSDGSRVAARWIALGVSLITLYWATKTTMLTLSGTSPVVDIPWFTSLGVDIRFNLALDGLSLWMFALSALLSVTAILVSWEAIAERGPLFYSMLLVLETGMLGVFAARDVLLFYVFFEFTLIPLFFLIGIWGSEDRRYAAVKFFLFTLAGSMLTFLGMLAIVLLHAHNNPNVGVTFSIPAITAGLGEYPLTASQQFWIFLALFAGFAIKVPLFPLHTWLPLAHVQAPTAGSVLLAGILLKIGTYGFLRFSMPMLPDATVVCMPWVLWLSAAGIIYGALVALAQSDVKRLIAYSSVSHLGYCMLGLFALNRLGMQGGVLQMINHGLSTGGLFATFGMIYERYHTREIKQLGGLARRIPILSLFMLLFTFSSIGLPGMNGFAGEFLILLGMFQRGYADAPALYHFQWTTIAVLAVFGVVLGAWYMLWLYQRVFFGPLREPPYHGDHGDDHAHAAAHGHDAHAAHGHDAHGHDVHGHDDHGHAEVALPPGPRDMNWREFWALAPLVVFVFWIGLKPQTFLAPMQADINDVATTVQAAYKAHEWETGEVAPAVASRPAPAAAPAAHAVQQDSEFARVD
ncbi:MAG: NADH-quinone oxidoreductase subunit M [Planctomycetaceae bacterium]|nr:NADH-quinone oxidoreductase subunit M [Planctomycetaceae bacterium]